MDIQQQALNYFFKNIDTEPIKKLTEKIKEVNNNIYFLGIGKSYNIAQQTSDILKSLNYPSFNLDPQKLLHGDLGIIKENLIIIYSKSGNTQEILDVINYLVDRNCYIVLVTCNKNNSIKQKSNLTIFLPIIQEIDQFNLIPSISITLYTIFTNYLIQELSSNLSSENYSKNHPAGNIGKKSNLRVKNIMKPFEECCVMNINNTLRECIINMTSKRSQCCIFLSNKKLYGIITDYDIRNYLENNDNININVDTIINKKPKYVKYNTKLNTIQNEYSNLSGIPVINDNYDFIGLINTKTLIKIYQG